jgi:hypothetical protein
MSKKDYIIHQLLRLCDDADTGRFAREEITRMVKLIDKNLTDRNLTDNNLKDNNN